MSTGPDTEHLKHLSPVWSRGTDLIAVRGEGSYLYDPDGNAYLDFTCGIGVTNTGHCHPRVVKAVQDQAGLLLHGQANIAWHPPLLALVAALRPLLPDRLDGFFFSNSGAEAIEGAVKLARIATGRTNVVVFQGSFHGRTVGTMSLTTSKTIYRAGYQPLMPGVFVAPYPYSFRYGWSPKETVRWCLQELEFLLHTQTAPEETAAFLVEPILGEGGYVVPPPEFLPGLRRIADLHDILLICDEVQSGFGRSGRWFGYQHFDVEPDIVVLAKGLASGLPLSAVVAPLELMARWQPGSHGGTYGGNAVAAAAAAATVEVIQEEGLLENAVARGQQLMQGLKRLQSDETGIADVRGLGLMIGCEFRRPDGAPDKETAMALLGACFERGLLLLSCGPWDNTIRWIPPLTVSSAEIDEGLETFSAALDAAR
jgi:4-aminobutyrate aminotransferase